MSDLTTTHPSADAGDTPESTPSTQPVTAVRADAGRRRIIGWALAALGVLVVWAIPLFVTDPYLLVLNWIMVGAVGGMGLTMLIGQAGQLSLAHSFFVLIGGAAYAVLAALVVLAGGVLLAGRRIVSMTLSDD